MQIFVSSKNTSIPTRHSHGDISTLFRNVANESSRRTPLSPEPVALQRTRNFAAPTNWPLDINTLGHHAQSFVWLRSIEMILDLEACDVANECMSKCGVIRVRQSPH
jgi:hypothetical protein